MDRAAFGLRSAALCLTPCKNVIYDVTLDHYHNIPNVSP